MTGIFTPAYSVSKRTGSNGGCVSERTQIRWLACDGCGAGDLSWYLMADGWGASAVGLFPDDDGPDHATPGSRRGAADLSIEGNWLGSEPAAGLRRSVPGARRLAGRRRATARSGVGLRRQERACRADGVLRLLRRQGSCHS